ncbi:MAG: ATPase domain-containing protein [Candidatus Micrarchaeota archaeon]
MSPAKRIALPQALPSERPKGASAGASSSGPEAVDLLIQRTPSGIPGLDELCEGGFERGSSVLVMGDAGSGKTTLMTQFIVSGAREHDEPGLIISFEESRESILRHSFPFGWDMERLERENKLVIINYKPHEVKHLAEEGGGLIWDAINELGAKRIAFDSLTSYIALFDSPYKSRSAQLNLFDLVHKWGCTTLFSAESLKSINPKTYAGVEYLADAVILMHHPRQRNVRFRALEVFKMRGTNHSQKICPFEFVSGQGLFVYPGEDIFEEFHTKGGL